MNPSLSASIMAVSSIGTTELALQYLLLIPIISVFRRYPHRAKALLWTAMGVSCGSMLLSSWATEVRHASLKARGECTTAC